MSSFNFGRKVMLRELPRELAEPYEPYVCEYCGNDKRPAKCPTCGAENSAMEWLKRIVGAAKRKPKSKEPAK